MIEYKIDYSEEPHKELELIGRKGFKTTWRVYWEEKTETSPRTVQDETTEEIKTYVTKYVEVEKPINETPSAVEIIQELVINEITEYDTSENVNSFCLNGLTVWLDKDTRVGLMNSTTIQKNAGLETSVLWLGTMALEVPCDQAIQLLSALEIYALECFNITAEHKKNVLALDNIDDLVNYDYTKGYPEKLIMNV